MGGATLSPRAQDLRALRRRAGRVGQGAPGADGASIVYCFGTLHGEALSGESFAGIRFIDRFTVAGGLIRDQMVWNDMAEMLGAPRAD